MRRWRILLNIVHRPLSTVHGKRQVTMFTGIVRELGTVASARRTKGLLTVQVYAPRTAASIGLGESVAINGACLSVVRMGQGAMTFEVIPETQRLTTLGKLRVGSVVNVEPSLTLTDRLNGHVVLGHIDGVGRIVRQTQQSGDVAMEIHGDPSVHRYLVPKGPIAVDGVSLTVGASVTSRAFSVFLIPDTLHNTTLGSRKAGDWVNLEVDYLAKLVMRRANHRQNQ